MPVLDVDARSGIIVDALTMKVKDGALCVWCRVFNTFYARTLLQADIDILDVARILAIAAEPGYGELLDAFGQFDIK